MLILLERGFLKIMSKPRSGIAKLLTRDGPTLNMHWAGCFTLESEFLRTGRRRHAGIEKPPHRAGKRPKSLWAIYTKRDMAFRKILSRPLIGIDRPILGTQILTAGLGACTVLFGADV